MRAHKFVRTGIGFHAQEAVGLLVDLGMIKASVCGYRIYLRDDVAREAEAVSADGHVLSIVEALHAHKRPVRVGDRSQWEGEEGGGK